MKRGRRGREARRSARPPGVTPGGRVVVSGRCFTEILRTYVAYEFLIFCVSFFALRDEIRHTKMESTLLPQAKVAFCVSPTLLKLLTKDQNKLMYLVGNKGERVAKRVEV